MTPSLFPSLSSLLAVLGLLAGVAWRRPRLAMLAAYPYVIHKVDARPLRPGFRTPRGLARFGVDVVTGALVDATEVAMRLRTLSLIHI